MNIDSTAQIAFGMMIGSAETFTPYQIHSAKPSTQMVPVIAPVSPRASAKMSGAMSCMTQPVGKRARTRMRSYVWAVAPSMEACSSASPLVTHNSARRELSSVRFVLVLTLMPRAAA